MAEWQPIASVAKGLLKWVGTFVLSTLIVFAVLMIIGASLWFITWTVPHPHWWPLIRVSAMVGFVLSLFWLAGRDG